MTSDLRDGADVAGAIANLLRATNRDDPGYEAVRRCYAVALDAAGLTSTAAALDAAVTQREAVPGMPSEGPYPATLDECADEVAAWVRRFERDFGGGFTDMVVERLIGRVGVAEPVGWADSIARARDAREQGRKLREGKPASFRPTVGRSR